MAAPLELVINQYFIAQHQVRLELSLGQKKALEGIQGLQKMRKGGKNRQLSSSIFKTTLSISFIALTRSQLTDSALRAASISLAICHIAD